MNKHVCRVFLISHMILHVFSQQGITEIIHTLRDKQDCEKSVKTANVLVIVFTNAK